MKRATVFVLRWGLFLAVMMCTAQYSVKKFLHSTWYKERMYRQLISGSEKEQLRAASSLAYLGGQEQLLLALKSDATNAREMAKRALEFSWFAAAGEGPEEQLHSAVMAAKEERYQEALDMLNKLVSAHPTFAEAWNQRASVYWKLGRHDESILDCERTLVLNPHHYGAWQGMGICKLHLGEVAEACRCLREALKILPHDEATQEALQKVEALLRREKSNGVEPTSQII